MNKIAIIVILGLAAIASAQVDFETSEITDLSVRSSFHGLKNRSNITGKAYIRPSLPLALIRPHHNTTNKTIVPVRRHPIQNKTNKTIVPLRRHPIQNKTNKTIAPVRPRPIQNKTNKTNQTNKTNKTNQTNKTNKTIAIVRPHPIQNKTNKTNKTYAIPTFNRSKIHSHFKNFTKVNTTKVFDRVLPVNASTTEALELFGKHLIKTNKNLTQVSQILQLVGQLFLVGSQCEQDLGGAFFVASIVAADVEAGFQDIEQDVIASVFVGLLAYQSTTDCPPVIQVIEELISIL